MLNPYRVEESDFKRLSRVKRTDRAPAPTFGADLVTFFKRSVQKRQTKFGSISDCWSTLIPSTLLEHTADELCAAGHHVVLGTTVIPTACRSRSRNPKPAPAAGPADPLQRGCLLGVGTAPGPHLTGFRF